MQQEGKSRAEIDKYEYDISQELARLDYLEMLNTRTPEQIKFEDSLFAEFQRLNLIKGICNFLKVCRRVFSPKAKINSHS